MLSRALLLASALLACTAGPAAAATIDKVGRELVYTGGAEVNDVSGYTDTFESVHILSMSNTASVPTDFGDSGCVPQYAVPNPTSFKCPRINIDRLVFIGADGNDNLGGGFDKPQTLDGGAGDDILDGADGDDILIGGPGDEIFLRGNGGSDDIRGGSGADRLEGGSGAGDGADTFSGGDGVDVVNFNYADVGVAATIDGVANDGEPGEGDNVLTDVEDLWGSPQADTLTGSNGANALEGGGGNDTITGLGGRDELFGEEGNDTIFARDGVGEPVECGGGVDTAYIDFVDGEPSECEDPRPSDEAQPDHDGDGVDRPADCDDRDPARRPGLRDVPENGVDEDCSGADAPNLDRDADGFPVPRDCDDANAAIRPGAREIVGNAADENCDGRRQPFPAVGVTVGDAWNVRSGAARVARLQLDGVKAGTAVQMRCAGKGCAFKRRTVRAGKGRTLDLRKALKGTKLRKGAVLELRITRPDTVGSVIRFTGRRRGIPSRRDLCLPPGGKPGACR